MRRWYGLTAAVLLLLTVGFSLKTFRPASQVTASVVSVPDVTWADVDQAFSRSGQFVKQPNGQVTAGILPHHTLVTPLLAAFFQGLKDQPAPRRVVIIGPDHGNVGRGYATTARFDWQTPGGLIRHDDALVSGMINAGLIVEDPDLLRHEHGVYAVIPYLQPVFPKSLIVQIALKGDQRVDRIQALADYLSQHLDQNDLVVASVDFSHYKDIVGAWKDDDISLDAIRSLNPDAVLDIPVDSPPSISLLLRFVRLRGLAMQELVTTNSAEFTHDLTLASTTSYLTAYFSKP